MLIILSLLLLSCAMEGNRKNWLDFVVPYTVNETSALSYTHEHIEYRIEKINEKNNTVIKKWPEDTLKDHWGNCTDQTLVVAGILYKTYGVKCNLVEVSVYNYGDHAVLDYNGRQFDCTTGKYCNYPVVHTIYFDYIQGYIDYSNY